MDFLFELSKIIENKSSFLYYLVKDVKKMLLLNLIYNHKLIFSLNMHFPIFEIILNDYNPKIYNNNNNNNNNYDNNNNNYDNNNNNYDNNNNTKLMYGNKEIVNVLWLKYVSKTLPENYQDLGVFMRLYNRAIKYYKKVIDERKKEKFDKLRLKYEIIYENMNKVISLYEKINDIGRDHDKINLDYYDEVNEIIYYDQTMYNTLLIQASKWNNFSLAKLLLDKGANIEHPKCGNSALSEAVMNKNKEFIEYLIDREADVNIYDVETILMSAIRQGCNAEIINLLIKNMTKEIINMEDGEYQTALDYLIKERSNDDELYDIVQILINKGVNILYHNIYHIRFIKNQNKTKIIKLMLENADVKKCNDLKSPIAKNICEYGDESLMKIVLDKGYDLNISICRGKVTLLMVIFYNYKVSENPPLDLIQMFIDKGAELYVKDHEITAYNCTNNPILKSFLLQNGYIKTIHD